MSDAEFDRHAANYRALHGDNVAITGEEPEYFANYKMRDFEALVKSLALPLNGRYLDFGSGIGSSVPHFAKYLPQARLVCTDISSESLAISKQQHGEAAEYAAMPGGVLPFKDGEFDGAFACCVFHHIPPEEHDAALKQLRRVIKPGGLLMIYEHNPFNPLTVRAVRNCPFDENAVLITAGKLGKAGTSAGFRQDKLNYRVFFPAALAGLRPLENWLRHVPLGAQYFLAFRK